jgi:hypothetical protein
MKRRIDEQRGVRFTLAHGSRGLVAAREHGAVPESVSSSWKRVLACSLPMYSNFLAWRQWLDAFVLVPGGRRRAHFSSTAAP